jgi:hypothetical protein
MGQLIAETMGIVEDAFYAVANVLHTAKPRDAAVLAASGLAIGYSLLAGRSPETLPGKVANVGTNVMGGIAAFATGVALEQGAHTAKDRFIGPFIDRICPVG